MSEVTIIGIDLAKRVFQLHGACPDGSIAFRKKLSRGQLLAFVARHPKCVIAMEACATAHGWGRELGRVYLEQIEGLNARIAELDVKMRHAARGAGMARRAQTMPGGGPITALAIETFAPELTSFRRGRDFSAWLGLVPKQHSPGSADLSQGAPMLGRFEGVFSQSPGGF